MLFDAVFILLDIWCHREAGTEAPPTCCADPLFMRGSQ